MNGTAALLTIDGLNAGYGDTQVLWDISLAVHPGEMVALIGSNGAGKSTLLGAISGLVRASSGSMLAGGVELRGRSPDDIVKQGVVQVPQGRRLFGSLTVKENLIMGAYLRRDKEVDADLENILVMFPRLRERLEFLGGRLSGGEQQMVAIGRALMAKPRLLLIDEMSLGLAPVMIDQLIDILRKINEAGVTVLLVEQDVQTALEIASRAYVLETGRVTQSGLSADLMNDGRIRTAYLGL